jgi:hypothetical protein
MGAGVDDDGDSVGDGGGSFDMAGCCREGVAACPGSGGSPTCSPRGGTGARRRDVHVPVGI